MSATRNQDAIDAVVNQGEFSSHVPRAEPEDDALKHKPGVKATPADHRPEFTTETYPPGTAPADRSFNPNNANEVPITSNDQTPSASDTLGGATSSQVHTGLGHPGQGQTSAEIRHDGSKGRAKQGHGLTGLASGVGNDSKIVSGQDPAFAESQRAINREEAQIGRGNVGGPAAEDRVPESANTVAHEAPRS